MTLSAEAIATALKAKRSGSGWSCKCVAHEDSNPSMSISDVNGKTLIKCHAGCSQESIISELQQRGLWSNPAELPTSHIELGEYHQSWDYQDAAGNHVQRICRWDLSSGKTIRPLSFQQDRWQWKALPEPRPLYNLPRVLKSPGRVLVVEGEKAADAARKLFPDEFAVTCWAGGAKAATKTDWEPLAGRDVTLWPDADHVGKEAMEGLAAVLAQLNCTVRIADLSTVGSVPIGWDAADALADNSFDIQTLWEALINAPAVSPQTKETNPQKKAPDACLSWLERFEMTDDEADQIANATFVEPGLFVEGHVIAIVAPPNGGKTTIMFDHAQQIARRGGRSVVFVHADTNPSDAKRMRELAKAAGVRYLTPDMKVGQGMPDVVKNLVTLSKSDADLRQQVWFFDTLKKMANVINKDSLKATLSLMRKLSSRGMTCVLIAHTNKYKNQDGEYQYEGTGDLLSDVDELIYLEPRHNPDKSVTVSTRCAKRRANIADVTWDIHPDRSVTRRDGYVDIVADEQQRKRQEADEPAIEAITECLSSGSKKQTEVMFYCRSLKLTEKRVRSVLKQYTGVHWKAEKLFEKNAWRYEILP